MKHKKYNFIFLSLFPQIFHSYFQISIAKKSREKGFINYEVYNPRDFAAKGKVDDYPYGGGAGMLLKIEPLVRTLATVTEKFPDNHVLLLSPQGKRFNQKDVRRLLNKTTNLVFVCGHYEGFDERIIEYVDEEISLGDFVTMGGEIPSLAMTDSLIRGIPGVIKEDSYQQETFNDHSLSQVDFSTYTRPRTFDGLTVPEVLLSGNHAQIDK
jgi:tRNA (guanine37-N1)-methyltransferase